MEQFDIYSDIAARTNGDIYIGVVGPVRTGKSTFVTKQERPSARYRRAASGRRRQNGYDHSTQIRT